MTGLPSSSHLPTSVGNPQQTSGSNNRAHKTMPSFLAPEASPGPVLLYIRVRSSKFTATVLLPFSDRLKQSESRLRWILLPKGFRSRVGHTGLLTVSYCGDGVFDLNWSKQNDSTTQACWTLSFFSKVFPGRSDWPRVVMASKPLSGRSAEHATLAPTPLSVALLSWVLTG